MPSRLPWSAASSAAKHINENTNEAISGSTITSWVDENKCTQTPTTRRSTHSHTRTLPKRANGSQRPINVSYQILNPTRV